MVKKHIIIISFVFLFVVPTSAQPQQSLFLQMIQAFQQLDYQKAEKIGKQITADYESYTPLELLEAHKILGVIAYQRDMNLQEAKLQFEQALSIDRTAQLDSVHASIKTIEFFTDLKANFIFKPTNEKAISYRYLLQPDPRPAATLRSMILPGWGQLYKNHKTKGYAIVTSTAVTTLVTGIFHVLQKNAHDEYLKATDPADIEKKYDDYNRLYKLRNNSAFLIGGIWIYAFLDALITEPKIQPSQLKITFNIQNYPNVSAQFSF